MNGSIDLLEQDDTTTRCPINPFAGLSVETGFSDFDQPAEVANVIPLVSLVRRLSLDRHACQRCGMFESCKEFF